MPPPTPICPKCGYDQSGTIATWSTQCPTQGTCPECGFEFDWFNIFNPEHNNLRWFVEHARSPFQSIRRTPSTLFRLMFPNRFWKQVQLTISLKPKALVIWYILFTLLLHTLLVLPYVMYYYLRNKSLNNWYWSHFQSRGLYAYPELAFNAFFQGIFEIQSPMGANGFNATWIQFTGWPAFINLFARPISFSLGVNLMWLTILLVIPTTRKIAKIRKAHVCRAFVLSMLCTFIIFETNRFSTKGISFYWYAHQEILGRRPLVQLLVIWQILFWPAAIIQGWQIKPAKLIITLGTIAALLAGFLLNITIFILPDLIN